MLNFVQEILSVGAKVYRKGIFEPLRALYLNAPAVGQFGGWHGFTLVQVCGRLSGQPEMFWDGHYAECENMVDDRFQSFLITGQTILYFFLLYRTLQGAMYVGCSAIGFCTKRLFGIATTSCGIEEQRIFYVTASARHVIPAIATAPLRLMGIAPH
jgi:hypothetical protein